MSVSIFVLLTLLALAHGAVVTTSAGTSVSVWLGPGPPPHQVWTVGRCWNWNAELAPMTLEGKLSAQICRTVRVPIAGFYNLIADTSEPADPSKPIATVRLFKGLNLLEWRSYYFNHEMTSQTPVRHDLMANVDYKVCITGTDQSFDLCSLKLYSCYTGIDCQNELSHLGIQELSRRNR